MLADVKNNFFQPEDEEEKKTEIDQEAAENILAQLSPEDVKEVIQSVASEMLEPLQVTAIST